MTEKRAICFTEKGKEVLQKLNEKYLKAGMTEAKIYVMADGSADDGRNISVTDDKRKNVSSLRDWVQEGFEAGACLIFVSAAGIAVRALSGIAKDKLSDSPVIVMDDNAQFVIPVLSGHVGGGNKIALTIAELIGAIPVITTSTDMNDAFSADLFAKEQNLIIQNREGIKKVSAKAVEGKNITLSVKHFPPKKAVDVLVSDVADSADCEYSLLLTPKPYFVGVGTKRRKDTVEAESFILDVLSKNGIDIKEVYAICSIDRKEDEECLRAFGAKYRIPFLTFDAQILNEVSGEFTDSDYVQSTVGVGNVCERAAMAASMNRGEIVVKKVCGDGITVAVVKRQM